MVTVGVGRSDCEQSLPEAVARSIRVAPPTEGEVEHETGVES
jgi:hypothetical protein